MRVNRTFLAGVTLAAAIGLIVSVLAARMDRACLRERVMIGDAFAVGDRCAR